MLFIIKEIGVLPAAGHASLPRSLPSAHTDLEGGALSAPQTIVLTAKSTVLTTETAVKKIALAVETNASAVEMIFLAVKMIVSVIKMIVSAVKTVVLAIETIVWRLKKKGCLLYEITLRRVRMHSTGCMDSFSAELNRTVPNDTRTDWR